MTSSQFDAQELFDKHNTLLAQRVYLLYRHTQDHTILLFQLDGFYVELYYQKNDETVLDIQVLSSTHQLAPYFNLIPLSLAQLTSGAGVSSHH